MNRSESKRSEINQDATTCLYVTTDLKYFEVSRSEAVGPDIRLNNSIYRKLNPSYYAYLKRRIDRLSLAVDKKIISVEDYLETLDKFSDIHDWVIQRVDADKLKEMVRVFDETKYEAPER